MTDISQDKPENPHYQEFVRLLYEVYHGSEEVDHFDLHSEDPVSAATWNVLLDQQHKGFIALIEHVFDHAAEMLEYLSATANPRRVFTVIQQDGESEQRYLNRCKVIEILLRAGQEQPGPSTSLSPW